MNSMFYEFFKAQSMAQHAVKTIPYGAKVPDTLLDYFGSESQKWENQPAREGELLVVTKINAKAGGSEELFVCL